MSRRYVFINIVVLIVNIWFVQRNEATGLRKEFFKHKPLSVDTQHITKLSQLTNNTHFESTLKQIAIPRVSGTPNAIKVQKLISQSLEKLGWHVEIDTFNDTVPIMGQVTFNNVIARLNRNARRYLTLACHYDSMYFPNGDFIAATDSAVPCAMMLNLAYTLKTQLKSIKDKTDLSLMMIFFDGEEAFEKWGPTDSLYGARHLASKWEKTLVEDGNNYLARLDVLLLLDLIGTATTSFVNYFPNTRMWYNTLGEAETALASEKLLANYENKRYFKPTPKRSSIEDDHIPFMARDVPILHLIASPFPEVWHKESDNLEAIDLPTCENLNKIMRVFTARYLHLKI